MHVEPARQLLVEASTLGLRDRRVGRVADQRVVEEERVLGGTLGVRPDEPPADEREQRRCRPSAPLPAASASTAARVNSRPTTAARSRTSRSPSARLSSRLASSDSSEAGTLPGLERPVERMGGELLEEQRIPLGGRDDRGARVGVERKRLRKRIEQLSRLVARRAGAKRERVGRPGGTSVEQLRPREADERDRGAGAPADEVLEQVEKRRLGPVHVLEHDEKRPLARERSRGACASPRRRRRCRRHPCPRAPRRAVSPPARRRARRRAAADRRRRDRRRRRSARRSRRAAGRSRPRHRGRTGR